MSTSPQSPATTEDKHRLSEHARTTAERAASTAGVAAQDAARHFVREPAQDLFSLAKQYSRENPDVAACWAFAFGIVVGWKLKP